MRTLPVRGLLADNRTKTTEVTHGATVMPKKKGHGEGSRSSNGNERIQPWGRGRVWPVNGAGELTPPRYP